MNLIIVALFFLFRCSLCTIPVVNLKCSDVPSFSINSNIDVTSLNITNYGYYPSFPCAYDAKGICRGEPYLSVASNSTFICKFNLKNYVVSADGGLFHMESNEQALFSDPSMSGPYEPVYRMSQHTEWNSLIYHHKFNYMPRKLPKTYDTVVPLRMHWDDCFNHISFQTMPLIGAVREFYPDIWDKITFHSSLFIAAVIKSLGVSDDRIVIETQIQSKNVLLPWVPHWVPVQHASIRGISARVCAELTQGLLQWKFSKSALPVENLMLFSPSHPNTTEGDLISPSVADMQQYRYIVYVSRSGQDTRGVYQEDQLLRHISSIINTDRYKLVVVGHTNAYKTVERLQRSWQRFARIFSRAIVMIGPHGGAWNNIIFTPADCHYIEFNYLPVVPVYTTGSPIRSVFLNAYWAKGGTGKFYIVEVNNRNSLQKPSFYFEKLVKVSVRDVVQVLQLIATDITKAAKPPLLRPNVNASDFPHDNNGPVVLEPQAVGAPPAGVTKPGEGLRGVQSHVGGRVVGGVIRRSPGGRT